LEFRVYAVSSRLKAELRAVSSILCPPDQDRRGHGYASAYPRAGGIKAINSRPKAGVLVREEVRENRMNRNSDRSLGKAPEPRENATGRPTTGGDCTSWPLRPRRSMADLGGVSLP